MPRKRDAQSSAAPIDDLLLPGEQLRAARSFLASVPGPWSMFVCDDVDEESGQLFQQVFVDGPSFSGNENRFLVFWSAASNLFESHSPTFGLLGTGATIVEAIRAAMPVSGNQENPSPEQLEFIKACARDVRSAWPELFQ